MLYFASKGLFIREVDHEKYVIEDVFGNSSLPFPADSENLDSRTFEIANIKKLVSVKVDSEFPDLSDFDWNELEFYYVTHIDYAFMDYLLSEEDLQRYHSILGFFPIGYLECGYGNGSKYVLEVIHQKFQEFCSLDETPVVNSDLNIFLIFNQVKRICADILSLLHRAVSAYTDLLKCHRKCIADSFSVIDRIDSQEIIHTGKTSYQSVSAVTSLVISLCSSLDLSAKLIQYINTIDPKNLVFKPARDKQYYEIKKMKPRFLSKRALATLQNVSESANNIPELIQFRNDLIHSTSAIELERIFVGFETDEINKLPLYYSAQYARDCLESGQPVRFLGRDYFVEGKIDIEIQALSWINTVFDYHLKIGQAIYTFLKQNERSNKPKHSDTVSLADT